MFVDTNILVSSRLEEAPDHELARYLLGIAYQGTEPIRISRQILREYLAVLTRPQNSRATIARDAALNEVVRLAARLEVLEDGPEVTERLVSLCREVPGGGRQIHDANIVATMLTHGEHRLLTFNLADFRRFGDRIELVRG